MRFESVAPASASLNTAGSVDHESLQTEDKKKKFKGNRDKDGLLNRQKSTQRQNGNQLKNFKWVEHSDIQETRQALLKKIEQDFSDLSFNIEKNSQTEDNESSPYNEEANAAGTDNFETLWDKATKHQQEMLSLHETRLSSSLNPPENKGEPHKEDSLSSQATSMQKKINEFQNQVNKLKQNFDKQVERDFSNWSLGTKDSSSRQASRQ